MWSQLCMLPSEVVTTCIFAKLEWLDVVNLDNSVVSRDARLMLTTMFRLMGEMEAPKFPSFNQNLTAWKRFWERGICLSGIEVGDEILAEWQTISDNAHLIAGGVSVTCSSNRAAAKLGKLFSREQSLSTLVSAFHAKFGPFDSLNFPDCSVHLRMLKRFSASGVTVSIHGEWFTHFLLANPTLEYLDLDNYIIIGNYIPALVTLHHMRELKLRYFGTTDSNLQTLAKAYPLLEHVTLYGQCSNRTFSDQSWISLAQHCTQLRSLTIAGTCMANSVLLQLALRCNNLRKLNVGWRISMCDAVLLALSQSCPLLDTLHCAWGAEVSVGGTMAAAPLLGQLRTLAVENASFSAAASFALATALQHTAKLQNLSLTAPYYKVRGEVLDALGYTGSGDLRKVSVTCPVASSAAPLVSLVQRNPRLTHLTLAIRESAFASVVEGLAQNCPRLVELSLCCRKAGVSDVAIVALAQCCPQLRSLSGVFGTRTTDTAVLALAQHCPRLQQVYRLRESALVTVEALEQLVLSCRNLQDMELSQAFSSEDEERCRRHRAVSTVHKEL